MKTVLIFGGNGFIGAETLSKLMDPAGACIVAVINRGKSWEWGRYDEIMPRINCYFKWNRKKHLSECNEFMKWLDDITIIDVVIDFSGYEPNFIEDAMDVLSQKVGIYIYISSDSVYEICEKKHDGKTVESDDMRPSCRSERKRLKKKDRYGHKKWKCEHILRSQKFMDFVILRLADVIGERDSTDRWWLYQLWIKVAAQCNLPIYIPEGIRKQKISLVYVKDVADLIVKIVYMGLDTDLIVNNAINLAFSETPTIEELLIIMGRAMKQSPFKCIFSTMENVPQIYPSVEKGPINIDKATKLLIWKPLPLDSVVEQIVKFYENVAESGVFLALKQDIKGTLLEDLKGIYDSQQFNQLKEKLKRDLCLNQ